MPKVSQAYLAQKREMILDAAVQVFHRKPLYEMTMLDVIQQGGIKPGGASTNTMTILMRSLWP